MNANWLEKEEEEEATKQTIRRFDASFILSKQCFAWMGLNKDIDRILKQFESSIFVYLLLVEQLDKLVVAANPKPFACHDYTQW